jgi:hypothetical protein
MTDSPEILDFIKALADADRLKIVGMLAQAPASILQIKEELSLTMREVFNHLEFLKYVNVVHEKDGLYELSADGLENLTRRQFEGKRPANTLRPDLETERKKVLAAFLDPDGTILNIPNSRTQAVKFRIVLEYVLDAFDPGVVYSEKEVNLIIRRFNADVAGLRRDLVDAGMLARERDGSKYWRIDGEAAK